MKRFLSFFIAVLLSFSSAWAVGNYTSQSVLSSGHWVKIKVTKNGVYKLTASDLSKMGFSDPSKVSIYGYGGWILDVQQGKVYNVPAECWFYSITQKDTKVIYVQDSNCSMENSDFADLTAAQIADIQERARKILAE